MSKSKRSKRAVTPPPHPAQQPQTEPPAPITVTSRGNFQSPSSPRSINHYRTADMKSAIEDLYMTGRSLHQIAQMDGMPSYGSLLRWMKEDTEFRTAMDVARQIRARHFEEEALRAATEPMDRQDVPAARLSFDAHVWAAEVNNPQLYGKKTTISGDPTRPLVCNVSTGVPVLDDAPAIELNADGTIKRP